MLHYWSFLKWCLERFTHSSWPTLATRTCCNCVSMRQLNRPLHPKHVHTREKACSIASPLLQLQIKSDICLLILHYLIKLYSNSVVWVWLHLWVGSSIRVFSSALLCSDPLLSSVVSAVYFSPPNRLLAHLRQRFLGWPTVPVLC